MISGKLMWLIVVQFTIFKDCCCLNSTQRTTEDLAELLNATRPILKTSLNIVDTTSRMEIDRQTTELPAVRKQNASLNKSISSNATDVSQTQLEIIEIFHGNSSSNLNSTISTEQISKSDTVITSCLNVSTCIEQSWNDTFRTNYSTMAEAVGSSDDIQIFRLSNSAAVAAGVFLISAVLGYITCVGYRRFLQRKYGNSQILIGEEVYDTTDLRNFEI